MAGKAVDGQRQHTDIDQGDGQAAECFGDGLAAQAVARLGHQHHSQQVAQAAAQAKADGLRQRKALGAITMGFRYYGVYETGVCFALLTVNSISGWMDRTESRLYQLMHRPAAGKEGAE